MIGRLVERRNLEFAVEFADGSAPVVVKTDIDGDIEIRNVSDAIWVKPSDARLLATALCKMADYVEGKASQ